jgi:hypothetical protein
VNHGSNVIGTVQAAIDAMREITQWKASRQAQLSAKS